MLVAIFYSKCDVWDLDYVDGVLGDVGFGFSVLIVSWMSGGLL